MKPEYSVISPDMISKAVRELFQRERAQIVQPATTIDHHTTLSNSIRREQQKRPNKNQPTQAALKSVNTRRVRGNR